MEADEKILYALLTYAYELRAPETANTIEKYADLEIPLNHKGINILFRYTMPNVN